MSQTHLGLTIAGKYQLKKLLGEGGMGAVYEGVHVEIGKRVAIKTISVQRAQTGDVASRFRREARAASAIESENIVQVFDVGHDPQVGLYMVMEHLAGEDLATRIHRDKKLDPATALQIFAQALHGLEKAHAAGIVHRDLKPANIFLVSRGGRLPLVKVLDFGISKFLRDESAASPDNVSLVTRAGAVMGTALYMSPEQAQGAGQVDHRSDIWSMGAVLYEALAGRTPYPQGPTYEAMIVRIVTTPPTPLLEIAPDVPPTLAAVIHQALKHDVNERIPDCATFLRLLDGAMPGVIGDWLARPSMVSTPDPVEMGGDPRLSVPRPLTPGGPFSASQGGRLSAPRMSGNVALTTGAGSVMVTGDRASANGRSDPPPSRRSAARRSNQMIVIAAVASLITAAAVTTTVLRSSHDTPTQSAAVMAPPVLPPVVTVAPPPAPPPVVAPAPSASASAAPVVDPAADAAKRAHRPVTKPVASAAPAAPAAPPAPSATAGRQFGGVDMSDSL